MSKIHKYIIIYSDEIRHSDSSSLLLDIESLAEEYGIEDENDVKVYRISKEFKNFSFYYPPSTPEVALINNKEKP